VNSKWLRSDHAMITCYLELYEEGLVSHINGVWLNSKHLKLIGRLFYIMHTGNWLRMCKKCPINTHPHGHTSTFWKQTINGKGGRDHWYAQLHLPHINMQSLLGIIIQKAQSHGVFCTSQQGEVELCKAKAFMGQISQKTKLNSQMRHHVTIVARSIETSWSSAWH